MPLTYHNYLCKTRLQLSFKVGNSFSLVVSWWGKIPFDWLLKRCDLYRISNFADAENIWDIKSCLLKSCRTDSTDYTESLRPADWNMNPPPITWLLPSKSETLLSKPRKEGWNSTKRNTKDTEPAASRTAALTQEQRIIRISSLRSLFGTIDLLWEHPPDI